MSNQVANMNQADRSLGRMLCALSAAAVLYLILSTVNAYAGGMEQAVSDIYDEASAVTQGLGTLALVVVGIGAMFGRISVTQALVVAVGISIASDPDTVYGWIK